MRRFSWFIGVLVSVQILAFAFAQEGSPLIRRNIMDLAIEGPELDAIRTGVKVMQAREEDEDDSTSWLYQAHIHGVEFARRSEQEAWATCQHFNYFFLSWHRMYLHFFEQILRDASGSPSLTLTYWDTSTDMVLPEAFRLSTLSNGDPNVLYTDQRRPLINDGELLTNVGAGLFVSDMLGPNRLDEILALDDFDSFGGNALFAGELENYHGAVHVAIGGWMSAFETAAQDPVFWFGHHPNIDRLWEVWLSRGNQILFDPQDPWMNETFTFFKPGGERVEMTGAEIINTAQQPLNYAYSNPGNWRQDDNAAADTDNVGETAGRSGTGGQVAPEPEPIYTSAEPITLEDGAVDVPLVPESAADRDIDYTVDTNRFALYLDQISYEVNPRQLYAVYLNLPEEFSQDQEASPEDLMKYFLTSIDTFGPESVGLEQHRHTGQRRFILNEQARQLLAEATESGDVRLTFLPIFDDGGEDADADRDSLPYTIGRAYIGLTVTQPEDAGTGGAETGGQ